MLPEEILFPCLAVVLLGIAKGGFGGVGAPVALPIMSLGLPVETAIGVLLPILLTMDIVNMVNHRRNADYPTIALALPGALLGVGIGTLAIYAIPGDLVGAGVGIIAILFALYALSRKPGPTRGLPRWMALPFGAASGFTSSLAHAGGPPIHIFLLSRGYDQGRFAATSNMFMALVNLLKVGPFIVVGALTTASFAVALWLVPLAAAAGVLGYFVSRLLPARVFRYAVNILMMAAGTKLILDAIL